ncbi:hypothetical protein G7054_g12283 [Neopestalotiopsis clavispora]|nr:hypothetical protein G7054_g12283 [Neopestalotiopsis clavispora]
MKEFSAMIDGAIATLSSAVATCCGWPEENGSYYGKPSRPVRIELDREPYPSSHSVPEKSFVPVYQQPSFTPPPSTSKQPMKHRRGPSPSWEQAPVKRHDHVRTGLSMKERFFSSSKSKPRRPQISGPTDFRHLTSGAPQPSDYEVTEEVVDTRQQRYRQRSFRPLELNIHSNANGRLSSMLPYFGYSSSSPPVTPPGRIRMVPSSSSEDSISLKHQQSSSTMSFKIPRKPTPLDSVFDSPSTDMIHRPAPARLRPQASAEAPAAAMDDLIERVATAMKERDLLEEQIAEAIERQTLYVKSRPSTPTGFNTKMEPMPQVPVLPPDAPSFSERISIDHPRNMPVRKPMVAPTPPPKSLARDQPVHGLSLRRGMVTPPPKSAARPRPQGQIRQPQSLLSRHAGDQLPPPPLRKKKSFSRVSTWLGFPADVSDNAMFGSVRERSRDRSLPVLHQGGFYEVRSAPPRKSSFGSDDTASEWTSDAEEFDGTTLPTTCSPSSSGAATIRAADHPVIFGQAPWRQSVVGAAF